MLERDLEARFRQRVKAAGGLAIKIAPIVAGVPDRLVILGGRLHLVELKTDTGRLSTIQMHWHEQARLKGVTVETLYGAQAVEEWIERNR